LLGAGAPVAAETADFGCTPLMYAVISGDPECVQAIVGAGGATPADVEVLRHMAGALHGEEGGAAISALLP